MNASIDTTLDPLFSPLARSDAPGGVVGVALGGSTVYRRGLGLASIQHGVANAASTRVRIGSTSKHFACLAALLLAEEGLLDLDAPATRYLPELPPLRGVPTLRQFMTHTSGYRCGLAMSLLANGVAMQPAGWNLAALSRQQDVNFAPGEDQSYCNGGYHLLSIAIERVSGMPLAAFLKLRLFEPLFMRDTELVPGDHGCVPGMATPHVPAPGGTWRRGFLPSEEVLGEGGIVSTVDDMLRWLAHLNRPRHVGSAESWRQMFEPARLNNGHVASYSLGLERHRYRGLEVLHHGGTVFGGNSQMLSVPAHGLDVVIMLNGAAASAGDLALSVVEALLPQHLEPPLPTVDARRFQHLVGARYFSDDGRLVAFDELHGALAMAMQHGLSGAALVDFGDRIGTEPLALNAMDFDPAEMAANANGGAPQTLSLHRNGRVERLNRLEKPPATPAAVGASLIGSFHSHDLGADAVIEREGEALVLRLRGEFSAWRRLELQPYSAQVFGVGEPEVTVGRAVLTIDASAVGAPGGVQAFQLGDSRARHLKFVRT